MPNVRFKVHGAGKPTQKAEIALDETFDAGVASLLAAAALEAHPGTWLSLNKTEQLSAPSCGRFFSVIRPGDLIWIMAPSFRSERPAPQPQTIQPAQMVSDAGGSPEGCCEGAHVADQHCSESMIELANHIVNTQSPVSAREVAVCLLHSAAVDSGLQIRSGAKGSVLSTCLEASGNDQRGLWRRQYASEQWSSKLSVTLSVFEIAETQLVYAHIEGATYKIRQQVVPNGLLLLPDSAQKSLDAVMASLQPVYSNLKSKLMVWAANALLLSDSKQQQCGFLALPTEALTNTLSRLNYGDVAVCASVCKRMRAAASERSVWECLLKQEFSQEASPEHDPRDTFKDAVAARKRRREAMQSMHRPGGYRRDPHFAPAPRLPPQLPGVVGGDYDRLPPGPGAGSILHHFQGHAGGGLAPGSESFGIAGDPLGRMGRTARHAAGLGDGNPRGGAFGRAGGSGLGGTGGFGGWGHGPMGGRRF